MANRLFHHKVFIQCDGLSSGQLRVSRIQMSPTSLDHTKLFIFEKVGDRLP